MPVVLYAYFIHRSMLNILADVKEFHKHQIINSPENMVGGLVVLEQICFNKHYKRWSKCSIIKKTFKHIRVNNVY